MICRLRDLRMVMLQFSFSNPDHVPSFIFDRRKETADESNTRQEHKALSNTDGLIPKPYPTSVMLEGLPMSLLEANWVMVDGFFQRRINPKNPDASYNTVRFSFVQESNVDKTAEQKLFQRHFMPVVFCELQEIVQLALWRLRMYNNQHYSNGAAAPGQRALSINLEARQPLYESDGRSSKYNGKPVVAEKKLVLNTRGEFNLISFDLNYQISKLVNDIWGQQSARSTVSSVPNFRTSVKTGWLKV